MSNDKQGFTGASGNSGPVGAAPVPEFKETLGGFRVNTNSNPSGDDDVTTINAMCAQMINFMEAVKWSEKTKSKSPHVQGEIARLVAITQSNIETAAMYAVKAVTKPERQ